MSIDLTPPDFTRCQADIREGSFMTLGPRSWARCPAPATYLARENAPGVDGLQGAMTVCDDCRAVMLAQLQDGTLANITLIPLALAGDFIHSAKETS